MFAPVHAHEGLFCTHWTTPLSIDSRLIVACRRSQALSRTHCAGPDDKHTPTVELAPTAVSGGGDCPHAWLTGTVSEIGVIVGGT